MFIINKKTPVIIQGITNRIGTIYTELSLAYGTNIVAGIAREKGVKKVLDIPIYETVKEAVSKTGAKVTVVFSTVNRVFDDVMQAIKAKVSLIICTTEHIPLQVVLMLKENAVKAGVSLLGPSSAGIVFPSLKIVLGSIPAHLFPSGNIGIVSRSSSLTYEAVQQLKKTEQGVSACIMLGSLPILGVNFVEAVKFLLKDTKTKSIFVIGDLTGNFEEELAFFYKKQKKKKPLFVYIAGKKLPVSWRKPLVGEHIYEPSVVVENKLKALVDAGAFVVYSLEDIPEVIKENL